MKSISSQVGSALILLSIAFIPGCNWKEKLGLEKKADQTTEAIPEGDVLVTKGGKPALSCAEFEKQFQELIEKHPYGKMLVQMEGIDRQYCQGLVSQLVIDEWAKQNDIEKLPEFQSQLKNLTQMLKAQFFQMKHPATVSATEIKSFYDQNKDAMPEAILSRGGVNTTGVSFANEADAKAFLEKAKGKGATLEKLAKESNLADKFRDFKLVNANSPAIDATLRDKIVALKKFPTLELIKAGDTYWVIYAANKEEQKYRSFEELKPAIEQRLMGKKQEEAMDQAIKQLMKDYDIKVHEEYFQKKAGQGAPQEIINEEQLEMVMPEAPAAESARAPRPASPARAA
jgi:hypothetical protein